jgi:hypothetical protein
MQLKDFIDEQAKINKDTITKFKAMDNVGEQQWQGDDGRNSTIKC